MISPKSRPWPEVGQWWRLNGNAGVVSKLLPGGASGMGIAVFEGDIPPAHVTTMLQFDAWAYIGTSPPPGHALEAPCSCITTADGLTISNGCARHDAAASQAAAATTAEPLTLSP